MGDVQVLSNQKTWRPQRSRDKLVLETILDKTIGTEKIDKWLPVGRGGDDYKGHEGIWEGGVMELLYILIMAVIICIHLSKLTEVYT